MAKKFRTGESYETTVSRNSSKPKQSWKKTTPLHIILKLFQTSDKEKSQKQSRVKDIMYKER